MASATDALQRRIYAARGAYRFGYHRDFVDLDPANYLGTSRSRSAGAMYDQSAQLVRCGQSLCAAERELASNWDG